MINWISPRLLYIGLILEVIVLLFSYFESDGDTGTFFRAAARLSGRVSLLFFALLFVETTLRPALGRESEAFRVKYLLFRDFAILHVIHWFLLATSIWLNGFDLVPFRVAGGALAYLLIVGMPFLLKYNGLTERNLGRVQGFYLFWVWLVFFLTYLTRLRGQTPDSNGSPLAWWPLAGITAGLMIWRIWKLWTRRKEPFIVET